MKRLKTIRIDKRQKGIFRKTGGGGAGRMDSAICVNCCIPDDVSLYFHRR